MNTPIRLTGCALLVTALAAPAVQAQTRADERYPFLERDEYSGFFISGSYGGYRVDNNDLDDDRDFVGASAGWFFNRFLGLELDYIDFGKFGEDDVEADLKGFSLAVIGRLPVTDAFGIYARAGAFASSFDVDAFDDSETYDEVDPVFGAGVDYRVHERVTLFAQYDRYNVDLDKQDFDGRITDDSPKFDAARLGLRLVF